MGCHTWFYRKEERSLVEAKRLAMEDCIKAYDQMVASSKNPIMIAAYNDLKKPWPEEAMESANYYLDCYNRMVDNTMADEEIWTLQPDDQYELYEDKFYTTDDSMPHDIFRIGGYPEIFLMSFQETLQFLEDNKDKIYYRGHIGETETEAKLKILAIERLEEFWEKYPDGMIQFG